MGNGRKGTHDIVGAIALGFYAQLAAAASDAGNSSGPNSIGPYVVLALVLGAVALYVRRAWNKRNSSKSPRNAPPALLYAYGVLALTLASRSLLIEERVKTWNLDDESLLFVLGYMAGFLDAAYQSSRPGHYDEVLMERIFDAAITEHLAQIPAVQKHLEWRKTLPPVLQKREPTLMGGLQGYPAFMKAQLIGGREFVDCVNANCAHQTDESGASPGFIPGRGLADLLGSVSPVNEEARIQRIVDAALAGCNEPDKFRAQIESEISKGTLPRDLRWEINAIWIERHRTDEESDTAGN